MTIDPNATLSALRIYLNGVNDFDDANAHLAAGRAADLIDHLDAGGQLPDAWTPFYAPAADLAAALQTIEQAAETDILGNEFKHEPDPRSIAGTLGAAINAWQNASPDEIEPCGDDLTNAARALLDCQPDEDQPTYLELAATLEQRDRDLDKQDAAWRERTRTLLQRQTTADRLLSERLDTIDRLRADLAEARSEMTRRHEAHVRTVDELRNELQTAHSAISHLKEQRNAQLQQAAAAGSRAPSPNAAYAAVARVAANLAETTTSDSTGDYSDLRQAMSDTIGHATTFRTNEEATRVTLAAFLAAGAARFGSKRRDIDLTQRTADYLNELASQLDNKPPRTIER